MSGCKTLLTTLESASSGVVVKVQIYYLMQQIPEQDYKDLQILVTCKGFTENDLQASAATTGLPSGGASLSTVNV